MTWKELEGKYLGLLKGERGDGSDTLLFSLETKRRRGRGRKEEEEEEEKKRLRGEKRSD